MIWWLEIVFWAVIVGGAILPWVVGPGIHRRAWERAWTEADGDEQCRQLRMRLDALIAMADEAKAEHRAVLRRLVGG